MRRTVRFFLHCAIAFFLVLVSTITVQLVLNAPMPIGGRVSGLRIDSVFIPGRAVSCTQAGQQDRCQISLFDRPLEVTLIPGRGELKQCQMSYSGQTASCQGDYHRFIIGGWMPVVSTQSNLGLSAAQLGELRERYPQRNFVLQDVGEERLLKGATLVAIAAGIFAVLLGWLHFGRPTVFLGAGLLVFGITWVFATGLVWGLGYVD